MDASATPLGDLVRDTQVVPRPERSGSFTGHIPEAWKVFHALGGVTFAVALRAIAGSLPRPDLDPLYASAVFASPVPCGPVSVDVEALGGSPKVHHATGRLFAAQASQPSLQMLATFGLPDRRGPVLREARFPLGILLPHDAIPNQSSVADGFSVVRQSETRWAHEFRTRPGRAAAEPTAEPADGAEPAEVSSWIRYHNPPRRGDGCLDPITFAAPADQLSPALFRGLGPDTEPFVSLTLAMDMQFFASTRGEWILQHSRVWQLADGYACGLMELWDEDRQLLAISTQRRWCKPRLARRRETSRPE
jgi:hypothetical protein